MNGNHTAEEWAQAAARSAQRSEQKAETAVNTVLEVQHGLGRVEREMRETRKQVAVGLADVRDRLANIERKIRPSQPSLDFEDFEKTDGGGVRLSAENYAKLQRHHSVHLDGLKWRKLWRRVRAFVWLIVGGLGLKLAELGIERMFHK